MRALARDERGQVIPLLGVVMAALLGAGLLVFWLGFSTSIATNAQTAADAGALAAEQSVDEQWNSTIYINGIPELRDSYDTGPVQAAAQKWAASLNQGAEVTVEYCSQGATACSPQPVYGSEPDVLVTVHSAQTLPNGSISPGAGAVAQARASVNPFAQASPSVAQLGTESICDPSGVPAPVSFKAHGGQFGFFPAPGTNFEPGCEPRLAAHLDALAIKLKLHLVGIWGAGATDPAGAAGSAVLAGQGALGAASAIGGASASATAQGDLSAAHGCGAAVEVQNLPDKVTESQLNQWGLTRLSGHPEDVEFFNQTARCATINTIPAQSTNNQPTSVGNGKVHLVPLTGGPQGSSLFSIGGLAGVGPWPAISSYLPFYKEIAKQYGWDQTQLQDWLGIEQLEDAQGILGVAPNKAFGLAQFQTVNYCRFGPGSCPADNPTAFQEIQSMAAYIKQKYGDPANAYAWELSHHWY